MLVAVPAAGFSSKRKNTHPSWRAPPCCVTTVCSSTHNHSGPATVDCSGSKDQVKLQWLQWDGASDTSPIFNGSLKLEKAPIGRITSGANKSPGPHAEQAALVHLCDTSNEWQAVWQSAHPAPFDRQTWKIPARYLAASVAQLANGGSGPPCLNLGFCRLFMYASSAALTVSLRWRMASRNPSGAPQICDMGDHSSRISLYF